jgi:hypothetical protein
MEWVCYHKLIGFDDILIFSNDNEDDSDKLLQEMDNVGLIKYIDMSGKISPNNRIQQFCYSIALPKIRDEYEADWACVMDIDEFIVLKKDNNINDYLLRIPENIDGIVINWLNFNASFRFESGDGLVVDRFQYLGKKAKQVKSISKVSSIEKIRTPHRAKYKIGHNKSVYSDGTIDNKKIPYYVDDEIVINHYVTKSFQEFLIKSARGGGTNFVENVFNPKRRKTKNFFIMHNDPSQEKNVDNFIKTTYAYKNLHFFLNKTLEKGNLKEIQCKVNKKFDELSHSMLIDKPYRDIKKVLEPL